MSRLVYRGIEIQLHDGLPAAFLDRDMNHEVAMIRDQWVESGEWWNNEKPRTVYQVVTLEGYMFDIEQTGEEWFIYRVWD